MVMKFALLLVAISAVAAVPHKSLLRRPNHDFIDYYDCSGKANGNYIHPFDCTRFITCSNGIASDMACADCDQNNVVQCAGSKYLIYDAPIDQCNWPSQTKCETDSEGSTEGSTEGTVGTDAPTTTEGTVGTDAPTTTEAAEDDQVCNGLAAGQSCGENDCDKCGYCVDKKSFYFRCERTFPSDPKDNVTGVIVHEQCDDTLWWNPARKPTDVKVGGVCDEWDNLPKDVQDAYKADENCVESRRFCEYGQDEDDVCSENYWYIGEEDSSVREDLTCSAGLIWDPATETCRSASNVAGCENKKRN